MTVEFRPEIKSVAVANDKVKVVLEVSKHKVLNTLGSLAALEGMTINATLRPESVTYSIPYDKETNKPNVRYNVNNDGTVDLIKEEQTSLEVDGEPTFENREFTVETDVIDDFILQAKILEFPGEINPQQVLEDIRNDMSYKEIAEEQKVSEAVLLNELDRAREHYAPFAAAWNEKRSDKSE